MYKVKGWSGFQSYKDRTPPWIRLHRRLLDDFKFQSMTADSRALLPMLWLLASEATDPTSGLIELDEEALSFRLRIGNKIVTKCLDEIFNAGFLDLEDTVTNDVTDSLQACHDIVTDSSLRDRDRDRDRVETERGRPKKAKVEKPDDVDQQVWDDYIAQRKTPFTQTALNGIKKEAIKAGWFLQDALEESCKRGWQSFKAEWIKEKNNDNGRDKQEAVMQAINRGLASANAKR